MEYYRRWLDDTNDSLKSRQVVLAKIDEQSTRLQSTLDIKTKEVNAMSSKQSELDQLIKEDPERGKAVQSNWQLALQRSKTSLETIQGTRFNREAARTNLGARLADLAEIKVDITLSIEAVEADREYQISYYDLRESEADLRCNRNVRPGEPLLGSPRKQ
jgi:hypothetical protein